MAVAAQPVRRGSRKLQVCQRVGQTSHSPVQICHINDCVQQDTEQRSPENEVAG